MINEAAGDFGDAADVGIRVNAGIVEGEDFHRGEDLAGAVAHELLREITRKGRGAELHGNRRDVALVGLVEAAGEIAEERELAGAGEVGGVGAGEGGPRLAEDAADEDLVVDAGDLLLEHEVELVGLGVDDVVAFQDAAGGVEVDTVGVGRGGGLVLGIARVVGGERVADVEPLERRGVGDDGGGYVLFVGVGTLAVVVKARVIDTLTGLVGVVGTVFELLRPERDVLVIGGVADVGDPLADVVVDAGAVGGGGIGGTGNGGTGDGDQRSRRGGVGVEPALRPEPRGVVLIARAAGILGLDVDAELATLERDERDARGDGHTFLELESTVALGFFPGADDPEGRLVGEHMVVI